ncbi:hypothetical protein CMU86_03105 [Elizabethkingia anophelis]|nr:hypothetical protein [Elizabethkingia anophelis]MDV3954901.1 hypothetical protein [Elizabethkingia anophelis]
MSLEEIFQDKSIKAKAKVAQIGVWLISQELPVDELLAFADAQSSTNKATCIEAVEFATKKSVITTDDSLLSYVTKSLAEEEPRVKWESAKVIEYKQKRQRKRTLALSFSGIIYFYFTFSRRYSFAPEKANLGIRFPSSTIVLLFTSITEI